MQVCQTILSPDAHVKPGTSYMQNKMKNVFEKGFELTNNRLCR